MSEKEPNPPLTENEKTELLRKLLDYDEHGNPDNLKLNDPSTREHIIETLIQRGGFPDEDEIKKAIVILKKKVEDFED